MNTLDPYDIVDTDDRCYCWVHHEYENCSGRPYRICGECHHVYRTPKDLVDAFNETSRHAAEHWAELLYDTAPDIRHLNDHEHEYIGFCQYCLHDW